ncbi:pyruvate ferredoxin oxidoreductase [Thermodesulfobacteriota bacterium]
MKQVLEGSHAVSEAVRLARVQVVSAYPITPQTHIVEAISEHCSSGTLAARFICVESEHSAMASVIGAASGGVRTFTATSGQGLAYMHELLHWASGARLPIVMAEVNRALAPGWNIWVDQTDSLSQRDTGWIQFYCEDGQEVLDTTLLAYRLAEEINLPVMVILDAFFLSHTYEPVDIPDQEQVDQFVPPMEPKIRLDTADPHALGQMVPPGAYMEMRHDIQQAMERVPFLFRQMEGLFAELFDRTYGDVEAVQCDDADIVLVVSGTATGTCRQALSDLRSQGEKAGMLKIKMFRPFPDESIRRELKDASKIAVVDRNCSFGAGGIFAQEIRSALCHLENGPPVFSYIAGLGGRDITGDTLKEIYYRTQASAQPDMQSVWIGLNYEL